MRGWKVGLAVLLVGALLCLGVASTGRWMASPMERRPDGPAAEEQPEFTPSPLSEQRPSDVVRAPSGARTVVEQQDDALEDVQFWAISSLCSEPPVLFAPVPDSLVGHPVMQRLMVEREEFRLTDELLAEAEHRQLTLATLDPNASIEDIIVAGSIEVAELQQMQMACMMPVIQEALGEGNSAAPDIEDINDCSEPGRPDVLLARLDSAIAQSTDPGLIDAARGVAVAALNVGVFGEGAEESMLEVQDRTFEMILGTDNSEVVAYAFTAAPLLNMIDRDDWTLVETVALANPNLAASWIGRVLRPMMLAGRTIQAEPWFDLTRQCYAERCSHGAEDDGGCTTIGSILDRYDGRHRP